MTINRLPILWSFTALAAVGTSAPAQAQFFGLDPMSIVGSGGQVNVHQAIGMGAGVIREIDRQQRAAEARQQQAEAAARERYRRAELSRSKAGRAQLAREDRLARAAARREARMLNAVIGAVGAAIMDGGSGGGSNERIEYYRYQNGGGGSYHPQETSSGFYGNCHGGAAYGC